MSRRTFAFIRSVTAGVAMAILVGVVVATADAVFTVLYLFPAGAFQGITATSLIQAIDGNFYGTTEDGGDTTACNYGCGMVFKMTPGGSVTILHTFVGGARDGARPSSPLVQGSDGNFYGTTLRGGGGNAEFECRSDGGCGTIFKMTPAGTVTILHTFMGGATDGAAPTSALIRATDGSFYGTTAAGGISPAAGSDGQGTVFRVTSNGTLTILHRFAGGTDGSRPNRLIQASDGNFYGTTATGGNSICGTFRFPNIECGTVFRMTPSGTTTILHAFAGGTTDGYAPNSLLQARDGNFYGTTAFGGAGGCATSVTLGCGTIFKMTSTGMVTILSALDTTVGFSPTGLLQATDGNFYGTTYRAIFKMTPDGTVAFPHWFSGCPSAGALVQGTDNNFYGTTAACVLGTTLTGSTVFRLSGLLPGDDLVVDFGAFGPWMLFDGDTSHWTRLHTATPKNIVTGDLNGNGIDEVIVDFGSSFGIWVWANNAGWFRLHASTANRMVTGDLDGNGQAEVLVDFPGSGIWVWENNTLWYPLHAASARNIVTADLDGNGKREAIIDFPGSGIWVWENNTLWYQLHAVNSRLMAAGDFDGNATVDLVVDFPGSGLWAYSNNSTWSQVHQFNASHIATGDVDGNGTSDLVVDFGQPYGIWMLTNSTTWSHLHTRTSTDILTADLDSNGYAEVIINFGAAGLWKYANNTRWSQLHTLSPGAIAAGHINAP